MRARARRLRVGLFAQAFSTIPLVVAQSDMIGTVPERATWELDPRLRLRVMPPPIVLPPLRGALYWHWHERNNTDPRHRWFRHLLLDTARRIDRPQQARA